MILRNLSILSEDEQTSFLIWYQKDLMEKENIKIWLGDEWQKSSCQNQGGRVADCSVFVKIGDEKLKIDLKIKTLHVFAPFGQAAWKLLLADEHYVLHS